MVNNLKIFIKKILYLLLHSSIDQIKEEMEFNKIISFDVFDTLIQRDVRKPTDIFTIVEEKYNKLYPKRSKGYKRQRILAEKKARRKEKSEEINLEKIYENLGNYSKEEKLILMELERKTEFESCHIKAEGKWLYDYANALNKRMIIISDMYLDEADIHKMLEKTGYLKYEKLYVSSRYGLKKRSGNLFRYVIKDMQCDPKEILHIGDNPISDGLSAWKSNTRFSIL